MTDIEPGRYLCIKTSGFFPWIIREATQSEVDHTAIVLPFGRVAEAEPGGVIISPLAKYAGCYVRANLREDMAPGQLEAVWRKAESFAKAEVPYNFAAIGTDACDVLGWHWTWLLRFAGHDHDVDCSQMAAMCGAAAGADWLCGRGSVCEVTPADLDRRPGMVQATIP